MITYGVCLYRPEVYQRVCFPALLTQQDKYGVQIVEVSHPTSIFAAYEEIRKEARYETIVYLHDDVELLDEDVTERIINILDDSEAGVMGVTGACGYKLPWWRNEDLVGCWVRQFGLDGEKIYQHAWKEKPYRTGMRSPISWPVHIPDRTKWERACLLDGILLATNTNLPWPDREGWHGYDAWLCCAVVNDVVVGDVMVCHHNQKHERDWGAALRPAMQLIADEFPWMTVQHYE